MKRHSNAAVRLLVAAVVGAGAGGCATDDDYWETADFGEAVRYTVDLQTDASGTAGTGLDGSKALAILQAYRQEAALPGDVGFTESQTVQDVRFEMGN
ncbi:hypothetical protein [uncultured Thiohalocapsa sp.]|uniref:hypothetical protein n=1 Tax=uncultured Thiohalocapsa sp. TaxID=768990 RepID=UPI0025EC6313|nr:hypothetical protein [uncultured Thiohalocapsa sp.]